MASRARDGRRTEGPADGERRRQAAAAPEERGGRRVQELRASVMEKQHLCSRAARAAPGAPPGGGGAGDFPGGASFGIQHVRAAKELSRGHVRDQALYGSRMDDERGRDDDPGRMRDARPAVKDTTTRDAKRKHIPPIRARQRSGSGPSLRRVSQARSASGSELENRSAHTHRRDTLRGKKLSSATSGTAFQHVPQVSLFRSPALGFSPRTRACASGLPRRGSGRASPPPRGPPSRLRTRASRVGSPTVATAP